MSEVVSMIEGRMVVPDMITELSTYTEDMRFNEGRERPPSTRASSGKARKLLPSLFLLWSLLFHFLK
jgi:hypothetical protein